MWFPDLLNATDSGRNSPDMLPVIERYGTGNPIKKAQILGNGSLLLAAERTLSNKRRGLDLLCRMAI